MPAVRHVTAVADGIRESQPIQPKVAVYIRFSTKDQANGWTEEFQMDFCKELLEAKKWTLDPDMVFIDRGKSGKDTHRPELQRMLGLIHNGQINKVVSWRLDRMFRSASDALNIVQHDWEGKCKLVTQECEFDPESDTGFLSLVMYASFAEIERRKISERTMAGKRKNAENGKNPGMLACYGYVSKNGIYEVVPEEELIVKQIFQLSLTTGITSIAIRLNHQGIKAPKGKEWTPQAIRYILRNKFYIGIRSFGKMKKNNNRHNDTSQPYWTKNATYMEVENFIEPMIDRELFDAAHIAISSRNVNKTAISGRAIASPHLLTGGIAYCGVCGRQLSGYKRSDRNLLYYQCRNHRDKGDSICNAGLIPMEKANRYVLSHLNTQLLDADSRQEVLNMMLTDSRNQLEIKQSLLKDLEEDIRNTETVMAGLDNEYKDRYRKPEEERLSTGDYNRMMAQERDKLASLENQLQVANSELTKMLAALDDTRKMEKHIEEYSQFDKLSTDRQKALLRELLAKVIIYAPRGASEPEYEIVPKYLNQ